MAAIFCLSAAAIGGLFAETQSDGAEQSDSGKAHSPELLWAAAFALRDRRPGAIALQPAEEVQPSDEPILLPDTTASTILEHHQATHRQEGDIAAQLQKTAPPPIASEAVRSATTTFRRDPVEEPLLESDRWNELILTVILNEQNMGDTAFFVENPKSKRLAVLLSDLVRWRLKTDPDKIITFQGQPFYPLDAIPNAEWEFDRATLNLTMTVPADQFENFSVDAKPVEPLQPEAGRGVFFDYDLLAQTGGSVSNRVDGLVEGGVFSEMGVMLTNFRIDEINDGLSIKRLDTTYSRDFPDKRATLRIGDTLTTGGAFAQGVRVGGIQWATNFQVDPAFVSFPLPTIGGLAEQSSVVDVIVDNLQRATQNVPPGPFSISNVPVVTGAGEVQLRVTDLLGRERIVTQPYYVSSRLLKEDLHEFSYGLGFKRQSFASESFDYGGPLFSVTHRYGLTNAITGESHAEVEDNRASLVGGGALLAETYGLISGGLGASASTDGDTGVLGQLAYEYVGQKASFGVRTRFTSDEFRQAGEDNGTTRRVDQINLGFETGGYGRLGLLFLNRDRNERDDDRSLSASYSLPIGPGSLLFNAAQTFAPKSDLALTLSYTLPLGNQRTVTARADRSENDNRARIQYHRTRGSSDLGLDYRLSAEAGDHANAVGARFDYQRSEAAGQLDLERYDGDNNLRAGINGSVAMIGDSVEVSRRIGRAFGLVDLPGFAGVRVYADNQEVGRTDDDGQLIVPGLRPYQQNKIRLEVEDLPIDAEFDDAQAVAVPFDRTGLRLDFGIRVVHRALAKLVDQDGQPLLAGTILKDEAKEVEAWVAKNGLTQITGNLEQPMTVRSSTPDPAFLCELPAVEEKVTLPNLGEIRCIAAIPTSVN